MNTRAAESDVAQARNWAIGWLARREHSEAELRAKLAGKGCAADLAQNIIAQLQREGLQSDQRFAEAFVHARRQRGYGPFRIRRELSERGILDSLADAVLDERSERWKRELEQVRRKKFGARAPKTFTERAKQARFLQYRGFALDQIQNMFNTQDLE